MAKAPSKELSHHKPGLASPPVKSNNISAGFICLTQAAGAFAFGRLLLLVKFCRRPVNGS
jgi:hypothetical protein